MEESKTEFTPFYKTRERTENLSFYQKNRTAIWFWSIVSAVTGLGIIPWLIGWYHIIF